MVKNIDKNKRIAKNTFFLYIRMLFSMAVSLYTSRIILNTLGIEDFGIYNVVAGVISMFSFLNTSMTGATSRFLAYEIGVNNWKHLQQFFSSALTVHLVIALCILVLGETVGLWFLQNKLVIPENRMLAANVIYQFTIISSMITVTQVPYIAMIMAYERMNAYAYIEIINVTLKLVIVLFLIYVTSDKLIMYGLFLLITTLIISVIYRIYCARRLECRSYFSCNKEFIYSMFSFSGWDLYGNASVLARTQGINMLLNMFFGATLNAASGIAMQVQSAVMSFAGNVLSAIRPQVVKSYAIKDYDRMNTLICKASIYTSILLMIFTIPILIETKFILSVWLCEVPEYGIILCRYVLLFNLFANFSSVIISGIHATGKIKRASIINGTFYLSVLPFAYIVYKDGGEPQFAYIYNILAVITGLLSNVWTLHLYIPTFSFRRYVWNVLCKSVFITSTVWFLVYLFSEQFNVGWWRLICVGILSTILLLGATYYILMNDKERTYLNSKLKQKL